MSEQENTKWLQERVQQTEVIFHECCAQWTELIDAGADPESRPVVKLRDEARIWLLMWLVLARYPEADTIQLRHEDGKVRLLGVRGWHGAPIDEDWTGTPDHAAHRKWWDAVDAVAQSLPLQFDAHYLSLAEEWRYPSPPLEPGEIRPIPTDWPFEVGLG